MSEETVHHDADGRIVAFFGLSLKETRHHFQVEDRELYTWCALDTLFIPELLGADARVQSTCPATGKAVRLTVTPQGVKMEDPEIGYMSILVPDLEDVRANLIGSFCHYVHFFASKAAGERWTAENPGTALLTVKQGFRLAKALNARRYSAVLKRDDRPDEV